jgi:hypothetical protein
MSGEDNQIINIDSLECEVTIYPPSILVREKIERQLFAIAKEHAELAAGAIDRNDPEKTRAEMKHSIIAIFMSYTALEALSNNLFRIFTEYDYDSSEFNKFDRNRRGLIGKWERLTELALQKFKPDDEFLISDKFEALLNTQKNLRDSIIHYKPKLENLENIDRFPDNSPINPEFILFTSVEATKAIQTVRTFLETFEKATGYKVPKLD